MIALTRLFGLTLALLIAVTSQQMAMARGMTKDAAGQVILCTGQGPTVVTLDAQGNPTGPLHICPDCALTFADCVPSVSTLAMQVVHIETLPQTPARTLQNTVIPTASHARGPPLIV